MYRVFVKFVKKECALGASINIMSFSFYKMLGLGDAKPTMMRLLMADRTVKRPIIVIHDVFVKVESFIFLTDFVNIYCEVGFEVPIILERPLFDTGSALMWTLNNEEGTFNMCRFMELSTFVGP